MDIKKTYTTDFLETPVGTKMYLAITNRQNTGLFIEEVAYEGYTYNIVQRNYYEPRMSGPVYWEEPEFRVKFRRSSSEVPIFFKCKCCNNEGRRGYKDDEHLECDIWDRTLSDLNPTAYGFEDNYDTLDAYFTTNKEKFAGYLKGSLDEVKRFLSNAEDTHGKELAKIESKYKKEKRALETRFKTYAKVFDRLKKMEAEICA